MILSIIIPVYNAEKYLKRCLKSVFVAAVFAPKIETEVLLIDNNSSDASLKIAEDFAKESPLKLKILHCRTKGAAAVRNFGAKEAEGKYLWFIDSDDTITRDSISLLVTEAERKNADLVMMGATRVYEGGRTDYLSAVNPNKPGFKSRFVRYGAGPWQFLILRSWWEQNGFLFREGIIHEDMEMISALILYTDKFAAVDRPLYYYYQNSDSVLHKKSWDPHYLDIFPALEGLYQRFQEKGAEQKYHEELEWFFIWNLLIDSNKDFAKFREGKVGFKKSREMLKEYFPNWRKNRFLKEKPLKTRIRIRVNYRKFSISVFLRLRVF